MYAIQLFARNLSRVVALLVALLPFAACAPIAGRWNELESPRSKPVPGALNAGGARPNVLYRCGPSGFLAGPTCDYAFTDSFGKSIRIWPLLGELDFFTEQLPVLRPWLNKVEHGKDGRDFPYKMHLLTVSPVIVLIVPRTAAERFSSCGGVIWPGCIQSQSFRGNDYWFQGEPLVRDGSFWFTLEKSGQTFALDASVKETRIDIPQATLKLLAENGVWKVQRQK
jgi:hypothetical protein